MLIRLSVTETVFITMAKNHAWKWNKTKKNDIVTLATFFFKFYHQIFFSNEKKSATYLNNFCQGQNLAIAALSLCGEWGSKYFYGNANALEFGKCRNQR